ncbi:MAG: hypothetical protein CMN27_05935 [Salinisphaera sp.]|nr:hypothetical protein [Salinisphaera sp.]
MKRLKGLFIEGRLRAAFLCVLVIPGVALLAGCADARRGGSPFVSTFASILPGGGGDVGKQANAIPYASVDLSVDGRGGLLILAETTDELTFWQSSTRETVVLRDGYPESTQGLDKDLLYSRMGSASDPQQAPWETAPADGTTVVAYSVERGWRDSQGREHAAAGQASFTCAAQTEHRELPLTSLDLTRCVETVAWANGAKTRSVVWRRPETHRIWAGDVAAWPGGVRITWNVARPWW